MDEHREAPAPQEETALRARSLGSRIYQLDALRGIAAAVVVAYHARLVEHAIVAPWYLAPLFAGQQAVVLFFVLSGFVLSLPHLRGRASSYPVFAVRRITRIYVPFAVAALLSIAISWPFRNEHLPLSVWFQHQWHCGITWKTVAAQMCMWPTDCFNNALWSLWFELQLSLLMPLIMKVLLRWNSGLVLAGALTAAFLKTALMARLDNYFLLGSSLQIGSLFILGAFLALHEGRLRRLLAAAGKGQWCIFGISLFLFFDYPGRFSQHILVRQWLVSGLGAAGVLLCSLELQTLASVLRHRAAEYLGRISFSLYLVHAVFVMSLFDLLYGRVPTWLIYVAIGSLSLAAAHGFCLWIEEPAIQLARQLGDRASGRLPLRAAR